MSTARNNNNVGVRRELADAVHDKLQQLNVYLDQYKLLGYSAANLAPKEIVIVGGDVVFKFH